MTKPDMTKPDIEKLPTYFIKEYAKSLRGWYRQKNKQTNTK